MRPSDRATTRGHREHARPSFLPSFLSSFLTAKLQEGEGIKKARARGFTSYIHEACSLNRSSSRGNCGVRDTFSLPPNLFHLLSSFFPLFFSALWLGRQRNRSDSQVHPSDTLSGIHGILSVAVHSLWSFFNRRFSAIVKLKIKRGTLILLSDRLILIFFFLNTNVV